MSSGGTRFNARTKLAATRTTDVRTITLRWPRSCWQRYDLAGHSITYRIAAGPNQGRNAFTLQTLSACEDDGHGDLAIVGGFSLHSGVAARADEQ